MYLTTLGHSLTASGEIDRVALVNSAMEGPLVAEGDWQASLPFALTTATVYRDGKAAQPADIQTLDVVYYSKPMHTVWAWSGKATGTIQQINTTSNPTAATVNGQTMPLRPPLRLRPVRPGYLPGGGQRHPAAGPLRRRGGGPHAR